MMILEQLAPNSNDEIVLVQLIMIWYQILSWERKWWEVLKILSVLSVIVEDVFAFPDVAVVVISKNENKNYCNILAELVCIWKIDFKRQIEHDGRFSFFVNFFVAFEDYFFQSFAAQLQGGPLWNIAKI